MDEKQDHSLIETPPSTPGIDQESQPEKASVNYNYIKGESCMYQSEDPASYTLSNGQVFIPPTQFSGTGPDRSLV